MRTQEQIFAEYAELPILYGFAYALVKARVPDGTVLSLSQLADLLEQQLSFEAPDEAIEVAVNTGIEYNIFEDVGAPRKVRRVIVNSRTAFSMFDHARSRKQSLIYKILKIGDGQFREEMDYIWQKTKEDFCFEERNEIAPAGGSFYSLRFLAGLTGPANTKKIPLVYADQTHEPNWNKRGAIAAIFGVLVAVLAIIVAMWLDSN